MDVRPDLAELEENVRTNKWHELGLQLHLEDNDLVAIRTQCHHNISECRRQMFSLWLKTNPSATRKQLLNALKSRAVSEMFMAKQYEDFIHQQPRKMKDISTVHDQSTEKEKHLSHHAISTATVSASPKDILTTHTPEILDIIAEPDRLANNLLAVNLISDAVKDDVHTAQNLNRYQKANKLVSAVQRSLAVFNKSETLASFCNVLKTQGDKDLDKIADVMLIKLDDVEQDMETEASNDGTYSNDRPDCPPPMITTNPVEKNQETEATLPDTPSMEKVTQDQDKEEQEVTIPDTPPQEKVTQVQDLKNPKTTIPDTPPQKKLCLLITVLSVVVCLLAIGIVIVGTNTEWRGAKSNLKYEDEGRAKRHTSGKTPEQDGGIIREEDMPKLLIYSNAISRVDLFCTYLYIPVEDCFKIEAENPHDLGKQLTRILKTWLDIKERTWKQFIHPFALLKKCVKAKEIAVEHSVYFEKELTDDSEVLKKCKDINNL